VNKLVRGFREAWRSPRWRLALLIAAVSDAIGFGFGLIPLIQWIVDAATAVALLLVLGFSWPLLAALAIEAIPALEMFPTWTLVVVVMAGSARPKNPQSTEPVTRRIE
jgi:hypothetical protein